MVGELTNSACSVRYNNSYMWAYTKNTDMTRCSCNKCRYNKSLYVSCGMGIPAIT